MKKLTVLSLLALMSLETPAAYADGVDLSRIGDLIGTPQGVGIGEKVFKDPPSFFTSTTSTSSDTSSKSGVDNYAQSELLGQAPTIGSPLRGNSSGGPGVRINGIQVNNGPASNPNSSPIPTTPTGNVTGSGNSRNTDTPGSANPAVSSPTPRPLQIQQQPVNSTNSPATTTSPTSSPAASPTTAPATSPATTPAPAGQNAPAGTSPTSSSNSEEMQPITLYSSAPPDHEANKTVNLNPLYLSSIIEMHSFDALREESKYSQSITLQEAIRYVLDHGMAIKISRESMNYQHWLTVSAVGSFLPTFSMSYNASNVQVNNLNTSSIAHTFLSGVSFPVFQGGGALYSLLAQSYRDKAWQYTYKSTVSDVFLDVYTKYTNVVLQRVLMQIWAKTVEADEQALSNAKVQLEAGTGTQYMILQAETRLAADRQSFLQQGIAMRQAGLQLNLALNFPLEVNLIPVEATLTEAPLFNPNIKLNQLVNDAMKFNPGLRQYEYFRLTANRTIQSVASSYYPSISFFTLYQQNDTSVTPAANSAALGGAASASIASFLDSSFAGRVSNNALGQQYTFSPTSGSTSTQGANTAPAALPASSGGTPIAQIQSGSLVSSGAVAPSITGGGTGNSSGSNQNGSLQAPAGIFAGRFREFQSGFQMSWTLPNSGVSTAMTMMAIKNLARTALMQMNQEVSLVVENVHSDYLAMLNAREVIDKAAASVAAFRETLRLSKVSLDNGVGTYVDVMTAQTNYVQAVTAQAQAIVASNVAQAQLLHDMGMISAKTLTTGYTPGEFTQPIPNVKSRGKNRKQP